MADTSVDPTKVKDGPFSDVLTEMLERYQRDTDEWADIKAEGTTDMRYVSGNPWDDKDRRAREDASRPVMTFDECGQYVNQLINEIRQHKRAIQVTPIGYGANEATANFRQNLIRQIEYRSNAQQSTYTPMFENTVQRSYGFGRVKAQFVNQPEKSGGSGASFDQELIFEGFPNPDLVLVDSSITKPDGADMGHAWVLESWAIKDYKRKFPKAKIRDFSPELRRSLTSKWEFSEGRIQVAEYWRKETRDRKLLLFTVGGEKALEVFKDDLELPAYAPVKALMESSIDFRPARERIVERPVVKQFLTNGFEVLDDETTLPGESIPIVCCFGKILYVDEGDGPKRRILSLIRLARDPAMMVCYYKTTQAELVGMMGRFPYMIRRGSIKPDQMTLLQQSMHEPVAVIEVENTTVDGPPGFVPEMPIRNPYAPELERLEIGVEGARRSIQAAMGINPLPTSAQRRNEKSGVALKEIRNAEQQGSFHFIDSYEAAVTRFGMIANELLPYYYDTARDVTIRTQADETKVVRINDQQQMAPGQKEPIMLTPEGKFDVTLSTGPDFASEREEASSFVDTLVQSGLPQAQAILPLLVKLKNLGPIGQQIYDVLLALSPPPVQAVLKQGEEGQPTIQDLLQEMQKAQKVIDELTKQLQEAQQEIETEQVKAQRDVQIAGEKANVQAQLEAQKAETNAQVKLAEMQAKLSGQMRDLEVKLEIELAKIGSAQAMARGQIEMEQLHHHDDIALAKEQMGIAAAESDLDRMAAKDAAEAKSEAE